MVKGNKGRVINPDLAVYNRDLSDLVKEMADSISTPIIEELKHETPRYKHFAMWNWHARDLYRLSLKLNPKNTEAKKALKRLQDAYASRRYK